jgi:hypothetical protein
MYIPEPKGGDFEIAPAGNHVAICYRFIDLGTQFVGYKGESKTQRKVLISWEISNEALTKGEYAGQPFTMGKKYTWSMSEKATLRKDLESWRNKAFTPDDFHGEKRLNIKNIVGAPCLLSIVHDERDEKTYANIKAIASLPKGIAKPAAINTPVYFSLDKEFFDPAVLASLSEKLQETIKASPEYHELTSDVPPAITAPKYQSRDLDDEVPF